MPYNKDLDEKLFSKSWETEDTKLTVSVYSYNKGPGKIQISRENKSASGEFRFTKLGRLAKEEMEAILPLIQEAITKVP